MADTLKYDPARSRVAEDKLRDFIGAPIEADLTSVPGIGPATAANLAADGIQTTYQLIGKYLSFCSEGADTQTVCDQFVEYLASMGVKGYRSGITECIAERVNVMIPGLYEL